MSDPEPPPASTSLLETQQQHMTTASSSPTLTPPPTMIIQQNQQQQSPLPAAAFDYNPSFVSSLKRPKYGSSVTPSGQWKQLLPSPSPTSVPPTLPPKTQQQVLTTEGSSPSSSTNPQLQVLITQHPSSTGASSDSAASSPNRLEQQQYQHQQQHVQGQLRKGKHVSPVWKPYEMLMLAKGWHLLYKTASSPAASGRGINKSRAEKDREVAEFLNRHGVERDAKAAGTKWDNMLGDFRKVYQWERGGGKIEAGVAKSYFRLSPYERKNQHGLPTSFDEEVFEEMAQFMGPRMKTNSTSTSLLQHSGSSGKETDDALLRLTFKENDDHRVAAAGFMNNPNSNTLGQLSSSTELVRRIGKMKMVWEESVSLWGEEGSENGRMKIGVLPSSVSSFLNVDELVLFDESMVASPLEAYENGPLRGFSVDVFRPGQQVKVFGRRKAASLAPAYCHSCRSQVPVTQLSPRYSSLSEYQDPSEYYLARLKTYPVTLPDLSELSMYLHQPLPEELKFPLRRDVYRDLPQGKEHIFTSPSDQPLDCRMITFDILGPILRSDLGACSTPSSRDSYIALWDNCINSVVHKFCSLEMAFVRKPTTMVLAMSQSSIQNPWPNVTGFIKRLCLWRGEETDQIRECDQPELSKSLVQKSLWTYADLPYILGYYAVGHIVTICAFTRRGQSQNDNQVSCTDLISIDLSSKVDRLKALITCWRIATLLPLLADKYDTNTNTSMETGHLLCSDFERITMGNNGSDVIERTPSSQIRYFSNKRKWASVKEIYDFLDRRIPHSEYIAGSSETQLCVTLKPRGCKVKPQSVDQLIEALKIVSKCLVALHDLSFMHRDISWETVNRRVIESEEGGWFVSGFESAAAAPQMSAVGGIGSERGSHAPEMIRGLHGVKVDVWGIGWLIKTCGLGVVMLPMQLRELQSRCLEHNQEMRPTAADCYHHLLQLSAAAAGGY